MSPAPRGRETPRSSLACAALLLPTALVFGVLLLGGVPFCCDAEGYLKAIEAYREDGLFAMHAGLGYRAYLFPYLYSWIPLPASEIAFVDVRFYSLLSIGAFLLAELAALLRLRGMAHFWPVYVGFFVNPLLLVYVPYPLQESFLVLAFAGLLPWLLAIDYRSGRWSFAALLGLFFGALYMTRASHLVLALPVALLLVGHLRALPGTPARVRSVAAFGLLVASVVLPQSAAMLRHRDTLAPYPSTAALKLQLDAGRAYAKYATNVSGRRNIDPPMVYWNPLNCESEGPPSPRDERAFVCAAFPQKRREGLAPTIFTGLIHVYNGLNYDLLKPYNTDVDIALFSPSQLLSMAVVFLGGYGAIRKLFQRDADFVDWFLITVVGVTLAVTTITAVETRFGLLATASLSLLAAELVLNGRLEAREWIPVGFGLVFFLAATSLLSVYVLALSGALAP
jgi:hypothetical protein